MDILLIRHGESIANTQGIYQGLTFDTELSDLGQKQAQALARQLAQTFPVIDAIYSSQLKRTLQTAEIIAQGLLLKSPFVDNRLQEINHGLWEGKTAEQIEQDFPGMLEEWNTNPEAVEMPEGETVAEVTTRSLACLEEISQQHPTRIAVVTHDLVIRAVLTNLLRRQIKDLWLYPLQNAAYSVIEWGKYPQVISINVNEHLEGIESDLKQQAL